MIFATLDFFIYFVVIFFLNWQLKRWPKIWKIFLLIANALFYAVWGWWLVALLLAISVFNYLIGRIIFKWPKYQRPIFLVGLFGNLGLLFYFKYYDFFRGIIENVLWKMGVKASFVTLYIVLPVGLSFYIFKAISYLIDVYQKKISSEKSLLDFCLYISFFPQLLSGPIARADQFLPQLKDGGSKSIYDLNGHIYSILIGLFKKLVISSWLVSIITDSVFSVPQSYSSLEVFLAIIAYTIVIYCDFSGYSDIATGIAGFLGFESPKNFDQPYLALNIQEFWRKWHISLSNWFRDYVYIPLGGNRSAEWRKYFNIFLVMVVSGLWHGAGYTFLFWGALHGLGMIGYFLFKKTSWINKIKPEAQRILTFLFIALAWVPFRSSSIAGAFDVYKGLFTSNIGLRSTFYSGLGFLLFGLLLVYFEEKWRIIFHDLQENISFWLRPITIALFVLIIVELSPNLIPPFIYFNF